MKNIIAINKTKLDNWISALEKLEYDNVEIKKILFEMKRESFLIELKNKGDYTIINPFSIFGRKPKLEDFEDSKMYYQRLENYLSWEEKNNIQ